MTAGQMLRQAREQAGLQLASLAAVLKVPPQRLEALEADRYDQLPGMAFVRGLASSLARTLKLDVQEVLALLPRTEASALKQDHVVASVSRHRALPSHAGGYGGRSRWTRVLAIVIVLLLLGAAAIVFWPQVRDAAGAGAAPDAAPAPSAAAQGGPEAAEPPQPATPSATAQPGAMQPGSPQPGADPALALTTLVPMQSAAMAASAGAPAATPSGPAAAGSTPGAVAIANLSPQGILAPPTTGTVVFEAKGESWVEVTDGNKLPLLRRTLQAGERVGVSGAEPLSVTVGHAENVQVEVRGQRFDLGSHKRGNVARFQVK